jgi:hypothetical protein
MTLALHVALDGLALAHSGVSSIVGSSLHHVMDSEHRVARFLAQFLCFFFPAGFYLFEPRGGF